MQPRSVPLRGHIDDRAPQFDSPLAVPALQLVDIPPERDLASFLIEREQTAYDVGLATSHVAVDLAAVVGEVVAIAAEDCTVPGVCLLAVLRTGRDGQTMLILAVLPITACGQLGVVPVSS